MLKKLSSIGLDEYDKNSRKKCDFLSSIVLNPDKIVSFFKNENIEKLEQYSYISNDCGVVVYADRVFGKNTRITKWNTFATSPNNFTIRNLCFDKYNDDVYVFCEDDATGNELEFKINNITEFEDFTGSEGINSLKFKNKKFSANIASLCSDGTVIFPIIKDAISPIVQKETTDRDLAYRARCGDKETEQQLLASNLEVYRIVNERLRFEDIFSVFESYFLPYMCEPGTFSILAEINKINEFKNSYTGETVIKLAVDVSGSKFNAFINKQNLVGIPMENMRLVANCALQGIVYFK